MIKQIISISFIAIFLNGCIGLTPYDNEFTCKPGISGKCSKSIVNSYKESNKKINQKDKHYETNN